MTVCQCVTCCGQSWDREELLQAHQCRTGWRNSHSHINICLAIVGQYDVNILAIFEFLQWVVYLHLVPYILVSLQLQSICIPLVPVELSSTSTCIDVNSCQIQAERCWLSGSELQIEVLYICIYQSTYFLNELSRYAQRSIYVLWNFHGSAVSNAIFATYSYTSGQLSSLVAQVLERYAHSVAHLVQQTHWEVIPVSTRCHFVFFTCLYGSSSSAVSCWIIQCSLDSLSCQLQFTIRFHAYIHVLNIHSSKNAIVDHLIYAHTTWNRHDQWYSHLSWAIY